MLFRSIRVLAGDFFQCANLLFHRKTRWQAMVKNVISQHAQASGDGLRIPADHRFGMAALDQLLHLLRMMQAHGVMFLQIQSHLEDTQQPFVFVILVGSEHMQLLITLAD